MLSVVMLSVVMLSVVMLSVVMLSFVMLNVVAPLQPRACAIKRFTAEINSLSQKAKVYVTVSQFYPNIVF
jgi:hypothetical protein